MTKYLWIWPNRSNKDSKINEGDQSTRESEATNTFTYQVNSVVHGHELSIIHSVPRHLGYITDLGFDDKCRRNASSPDYICKAKNRSSYPKLIKSRNI
jgi:hypothetical protein